MHALQDYLGEVSTSSVACGVLGVGGNKGAVGVAFSLYRRKVACVCSHFAAHQVGQAALLLLPETPVWVTTPTHCTSHCSVPCGLHCCLVPQRQRTTSQHSAQPSLMAAGFLLSPAAQHSTEQDAAGSDLLTSGALLPGEEACEDRHSISLKVNNE